METIATFEFDETNIVGWQDIAIDVPAERNWYARTTGPFPVTWSLVGRLYLRGVEGIDEFVDSRNMYPLLADRMIVMGRNPLLVPVLQMMTIRFQPWMQRATVTFLAR